MPTPHIIYAYIRTNINDKHSTNDLLQPKNLRFSSRTNHIKTRWLIFKQTLYLKTNIMSDKEKPKTRPKTTVSYETFSEQEPKTTNNQNNNNS